MNFFSLLILLFATPAFADVLFLDLNNSAKEVEAARAAAKKSGREFVVFPDNPKEAKQKYIRASSDYASFYKSFQKKCSNGGPTCEELEKKRLELSDSKSTALQALALDNAKLKTFLAEREAQKKPFSSVVISGHDGTGSFSGDFGSIGDAELATMIEDLPLLKESIRSLHLWGCYTTSPGSLMLNWKKYFPHAAMISGYEGRAPLNDKPAGWNYLKGVLAREPELLKITDHKKLQKALRAIPGAQQTHAAILVCDNYASNTDSYDMGELETRCIALKKQLEDNSEEYQCYVRAAEDKCSDPPKDVGAGPVRKFYEILHKTSACTEISNDQIYRTYDRDQAIRLVFAKEVQNNFARIYDADIKEADAILADLGAPPSIRFTGLEDMTRQEMLKRTQALNAYIDSQTDDPEMDPKLINFSEKQAKLYALANFQMGLTSTMMNLSSSCVPFNWTEPNKLELSTCFPSEEMGARGVASGLASGNSKNATYQRMVDQLNKRIKDEGGAEASSENAKAKIHLLNALINRLSLYQYASNKTPDPTSLQQAELRLRWAESNLDAAKAGEKNPGKTPAALKLAYTFNEEKARERLLSTQTELKRHEIILANTTPDNKSYYQSQVDNGKIEIVFQQKIIEALTVAKQPDSEKSIRLALLQTEIGELRLQKEVEKISDEITSTKRYLLTLTNPASVKEYKTKQELLEKRLEKARANRPALVEILGEDQLKQPDFSKASIGYYGEWLDLVLEDGFSFGDMPKDKAPNPIPNPSDDELVE